MSSRKRESKSSKRKHSDERLSKHSKRRHDSSSDSDTPPSLPSGISPITEEDYFEKSTEFRLWLKESKHKYLDELSSKESRRYFRKFVDKWNHYELDKKLYKGVSSTQLESSDTTRYKWSFASKLDRSEIDSVRDSVDTLTAHNSGDIKKRRANVGPSMPPPMDTFTREKRYEEERSQRKYDNKKSRERREAALDEVAPRETGREAALAKKRALNSYHKRERSPDIELSEADLMGGDDFKARLAAERRSKEAREARQSERREQRLAPIMSKMDEYKAKENATMAMFKQMAEAQKQKREQ